MRVYERVKGPKPKPRPRPRLRPMPKPKPKPRPRKIPPHFELSVGHGSVAENDEYEEREWNEEKSSGSLVEPEGRTQTDGGHEQV